MVALSAKVAHFFQFFPVPVFREVYRSDGWRKKESSMIGAGRAVSGLQVASSDILKKT
jgi:hypothetical protein